MKKCFFCDIQTQNDNNKIADNQYFFARYDDFPLCNGHCEIIPKERIVSFFDLTSEQIKSFYDLIKIVKDDVRHIIPDKANYIPEMEKIPSKQDYL
ncbi:MAG: HIT domain-containing protein [Candidatus Pacebacteria bacterium]|nr:HIT domain-containing protein [Candidatus Paceibacterota bacterium]